VAAERGYYASVLESDEEGEDAPVVVWEADTAAAAPPPPISLAPTTLRGGGGGG
jgi:hypothetical protein